MTPSGHRSVEIPQRGRTEVCYPFRSKHGEVLGSETPRVHDAARRCGGNVAARGAGAAADPPGYRISTSGISRGRISAFDALRAGLRDAGYAEGNTFKLEARWARGRPEMLRQFAQDLVQLRVDVVVATARPSIEAARAVTTELPIVANDLESDPIGSGYASSLSSPGGNLTGFFLDAPTLCSKWMQQIGDVVPTAKKIAVLWDPTTGTYQLDALQSVARTTSIDLVIMEFRDSGGLELALESGPEARSASRYSAWLSTDLLKPHLMLCRSCQVIRFGGTSQFRTFPDAGGLMSYGPDFLIHLYHRVGLYVSKVLRGARPSDLPIERPTKFELVVNLKGSKRFRSDNSELAARPPTK